MIHEKSLEILDILRGTDAWIDAKIEFRESGSKELDDYQIIVWDTTAFFGNFDHSEILASLKDVHTFFTYNAERKRVELIIF
jgi:hypothetical protein